MEFLVRFQNVLELLAFVSNGVRLPGPGALPGSEARAPKLSLQMNKCEHSFYRNRRAAQTCDNLGV
jgi:hypothetical protein